MNLRIALLPLCLLAALPAAAATRGFDVRDMVALDRVSSPVLSPDGSVVVFAQRQMDKEVTKASTGLWMRNLLTRDMAPPKPLTPEGWNVNSPAFSPDGKTRLFPQRKIRHAAVVFDVRQRWHAETADSLRARHRQFQAVAGWQAVGFQHGYLRRMQGRPRLHPEAT